MKIFQYSLGQLQANCYLLVENNQCVIIDPGDEGNFILEEIQRKKLTPLAIFATHGHFDHVMAVGEIQASFNIPFFIHPDDLFLIKRLKETAQLFLGYEPAILPPENINYLIGKQFRVNEFSEFQIIQTPGHTPGGVCFHFPKEKIIFTGDTLFKQGIGRYDFSYSNKNELFESIKNILKLPEETIIYSGHGEVTTVGEEKKNF